MKRIRIKNNKLSVKVIFGLIIIGILTFVLTTVLFNSFKRISVLKINNIDVLTEIPQEGKEKIEDGITFFLKKNFSGQQIRKITNHNGIVIREESVASEKSDSQYENYTFLVDIESIERTYKVHFAWPDTEEITGENPYISCASKKETKYESTKCDEAAVDIPDLFFDLPFVYASYDENYNYTEYIVKSDASSECNDSYCIRIIDVNGTNRENALNLIREHGYDPDDYEIIYQYRPITPVN